MGPHFLAADRRVGRNRLPDGYVAVLGDEARLWQVIRELHAYAASGAGVVRPRLGVLFAAVTAADRDGFTHHLVRHFGASELMNRSAVFGVEQGFHYVIDTECITHIWRRHADVAAERERGQSPVTLEDFRRLPAVVQPRNITGFKQVKGVPRIVCVDTGAADQLLVVLEPKRSHRWLTVKTMYKQK